MSRKLCIICLKEVKIDASHLIITRKLETENIGNLFLYSFKLSTVIITVKTNITAVGGANLKLSNLQN